MQYSVRFTYRSNTHGYQQPSNGIVDSPDRRKRRPTDEKGQRCLRQKRVRPSQKLQRLAACRAPFGVDLPVVEEVGVRQLLGGFAVAATPEPRRLTSAELREP